MMKKFLWVPMLALVFVVTSCGASGGTADPKQIADAAYAKIIAQDFDTLIELMDASEVDFDGSAEVRAWRIEEKFDTWKRVKDDYKGDEGYDPEKKSGVQDEETWKEMTPGTEMALKMGLYKMYASDSWEKRLTELPWKSSPGRRELELSGYVDKDSGSMEGVTIEGEGTARYSFSNVYRDRITIICERKNGVWYLASARISMKKDVPEPPKDEKKED